MTTVTVPSKNRKAEERTHAIERLLEIIKPGTRVYTMLRHRAASGMSRNIALFIVGTDGRIQNITYYASYAIGARLVEKDGSWAIQARGCGMDMGYHLVYNLGRTLFGSGDECAAHGYSIGRNGDRGPETDGGYLLNHEWL